MTVRNQNTRQHFLDLIDGINVWKKAGTRAPHKPLLLLIALARQDDCHSDTFAFRDIETCLSGLIREYGPYRRTINPGYPFWRLQRDQLWEVTSDGKMPVRTGNTDPKLTALRSHNARGNLPEWIRQILRNEPGLVKEAVDRILHAHFPEQLHERLLRDVGFADRRPGGTSEADEAKTFYQEALVAYNYRCAISGFGLKRDNECFGLSPVLVRWRQAGGEFALRNAIVMSKLFADLFLSGIITVTTNLTVRVSGNVELSPEAGRMLDAVSGTAIEVPSVQSLRPALSNLRWHNNQVFKDITI